MSSETKYEYEKNDNNGWIKTLSLDKTFSANKNINLAFIIDGKNGIHFQHKHIPVAFKNADGERVLEDIPLESAPEYSIYHTSRGKISVFICKDFLVNHAVLPKWMDMNNVSLVLIPSFSARVAPFLNKLREMSDHEGNEEKYFAYANLAEYGGSDVINVNMRESYEPCQPKYYNNKEGIFHFKLSKLAELNNIQDRKRLEKLVPFYEV